MIPFYDRLKKIELKSIHLKLPQNPIIASDTEKLYLSGTLTIKIKDFEKAYTLVDDFQGGAITALADIAEKKVKTSTFRSINNNRRDFDAEILKSLRDRTKLWGIEIKKIKLDIERNM